MKTIAMLVTLASTCALAQAPDVEARADELAGRVHELERGTGQLGADVGESYRHLASIWLSLNDRIDGARVTITQHNDVGPLYRLLEATYAIDGQAVFHQRDESGALGRREIAIHDGLLRPGEHTLSIVLRYRGDGGDVVRYLEGYHFVVRSGGSFFVPAGRRVRLNVRAVHRGFDLPYEQRLGIERESVVDDLD